MERIRKRGWHLMTGLSAVAVTVAVAVAVPAPAPAAGAGTAVSVTKAYVTSTSPSVTIINSRGAVLGHVDVGTAQGDATLSADGRRLYVVTEDTISVIDTSLRRVVATIAAPEFFGIRGITILPRTNKLYVANRFSETVTVVDTKTFRVLAHVPVAGHAIDVVAAPVQQRVYVGTYGALQVIDTTTEQVVKTIFTGILTGRMAFDPQTQRMFIADNEQSLTAVVHVGSAAVQTLSRETSDLTVSPRRHRVYLTGTGGVDVLDTRTLLPVGRLAIGATWSIVLNSDGTRGYVVGQDRVTIFDPGSLAVLTTVQLTGPVALASR